MLSRLIEQKNNNSVALLNEFGRILGLENERFCVLGIFSPAPASAADETYETLTFHFLKKIILLLMGNERFRAFGNFSPAFGTSSDEESEALPGNRVYFT